MMTIALVVILRVVRPQSTKQKVRYGKGPPLLLLHGWPEFWLTWEPIMLLLADRFELIAPDLRGFGDSDKPLKEFGPPQQADDIAELINALCVGPVGLVAHDIGGAIAQALARKAPKAVAGLFFFNFICPGVGQRFTAQDRLERVWYFFFHETDFAPSLIVATPDSIRYFLTHLLRLWAYRKDAFDDVMADFVASYQKPGNVAGSLAPTAPQSLVSRPSSRRLIPAPSICRRASAGVSMTRCSTTPGPTGLASFSPVLISRCFPGLGTSRTVRTPYMPPGRSGRSMPELRRGAGRGDDRHPPFPRR